MSEDETTSRRVFLRRLALLASGCATGLSAFAEPFQGSDLPSGIGLRPDFNGRLPRSVGTLGKTPAGKVEVRIANEVLSKAPDGPTAYDVAKYFLEVGSGKFGAQWKPYVMGWPERWNPVIVTFFLATNTKPEGDVTPWCAAFVNWCCQQAGKSVATRNASSGSFRCFGQSTTTPRPGDIVVFKDPKDRSQCSGHGHVGFFVADHQNSIEVLGGNQIERHTGSHMISSRLFSTSGRILTFHSYRTEKWLHT